MGAAVCSAPRDDESPVPPGQRTILVVEDEPQVRALVSDMLADQGYVVLAVDSAGEALDVSQRYSGPIHALLSDVVMPEMSGPALAQALASGRPELRVVYMSGYPEEAVLQGEHAQRSAVFLEKPFTTDALSSALCAVLDTPPPTPATPRDTTGSPDRDR